MWPNTTVLSLKSQIKRCQNDTGTFVLEEFLLLESKAFRDEKLRSWSTKTKAPPPAAGPTLGLISDTPTARPDKTGC
ncbi:hypothetical protein EVAR_24740_1 [Eumeta japonica]|uniref:Uncharacterized protein n=1 Tax=Eumeta variegata TaxID=151549 RepID=A0A4C1VER8_EUMVA|nr:hypothetical protein EVAR_24740_1 [Eumeta japonica]